MFAGLHQFAPNGPGTSPSPSPSKRPKTPKRRPGATGFSGFESGLAMQMDTYGPPDTAKLPRARAIRSPIRSPYQARGGRPPAAAEQLRTPALREVAVDQGERVSVERVPSAAANKKLVSVERLETAWDAMEYFMRVNSETEGQLHSSGQSEAESGTAPRFVHLNVAENRDFRPYDLTVTDELHKNPEHWTMSLEGMLHVLPQSDSEFFTLSEWSANAIAFSACCRIPFFRSYTVTKGFLSWRKCVRHRAFCKRRKLVQDQLFGHRKSFRSTYSVILSACSDIRDTNLSSIELRRMYTLEEFVSEQVTPC
jgi:hypothetical protein